MSNTKQTAVKAGIGYTVGNILIKGISFMTLPVFSRLLTTEQFGVYNVFVSYEAILYVVGDGPARQRAQCQSGI